MAVVKMGKVKATLNLSVRYIVNGAKTQGGQLVTASWNPGEGDPEKLARQMLDTLAHGRNAPRKGSVLAYHVIQSFSPDDPVTPERAHALGVELMERIAPGHRFVIATHTDREHIHNHVILCPTDPATGRHMRLTRRSILQWRDVSDELCRREGLSVIERSIERRHGRSFAEIYASAKGVGVKSSMRQAIDIAAQNASDFPTFAALLGAAGMRVTVRGQHIVYEDEASGLRVRDSRLGMAYMQDTVMARMGRCAVSQISFDTSMVRERGDGHAVVWLPGTRRRQCISVPMRCVIKDGRTWRAFLPTNEPQTVLSKDGAYLRTVATEDLYAHFKRPEALLERMAADSWRTIPAGRTEAEREAWMRQARKLDRLRDDVRGLDTAIRATDGGSPLADAMEGLEDDIRRARAGLQAQLIANDECIAEGRPPDVDGLAALESREREIEAMQRDLGDLRRAHARHAGTPHKETQARRTGGKERTR